MESVIGTRLVLIGDNVSESQECAPTAAKVAGVSGIYPTIGLIAEGQLALSEHGTDEKACTTSDVFSSSFAAKARSDN